MLTGARKIGELLMDQRDIDQPVLFSTAAPRQSAFQRQKAQ